MIGPSPLNRKRLIGHRRKDLFGDEAERARKVDLVVLPAGVKGTNCGNCRFQTDGFCLHPRVQLPVTPRMCCALWDADGTDRVADLMPEIKSMPEWYGKDLSAMNETAGGALVPPPRFPGQRKKDQGQPCKQGEAAARTGCIPASGESPGKTPAPKAGDGAELEIKPVTDDAGVEAQAKVSARIVQRLKARIDKVTNVPVLKQVKKASGFAQKLTAKMFKWMERRYGKKTAVAVMASGQAVGWGATGVGAMFGVPLWLPGSSLWGGLPVMAAAEVILQAKKLAGKKDLEGANSALVERLTRMVMRVMWQKYNAWLEGHRAELEGISPADVGAQIKSLPEWYDRKGGFTGQTTDSAGRTHCFREGVHVSCGSSEGGGPRQAPPAPSRPAYKPSKPPTADELRVGKYTKLGPEVGGTSTSLGKVRVGDKDWFVKGDVNETSIQSETLASRLALALGAFVPKTWLVKNGEDRLVTEWVEGNSLVNTDVFECFKAVRADPFGSTVHVLADFLLGYGDCHAGNYMLTTEGRVAGVDKDYCFEYHDNQLKRMRMHGVGMFFDDTGVGADVMPIDPKALEHCIKKGHEVLAYLKEKGLLKPGQTYAGMDSREVLKGMEARLRELEEFRAEGGGTLGQLLPPDVRPATDHLKPDAVKWARKKGLLQSGIDRISAVQAAQIRRAKAKEGS